ncbi:Uncharacterized protein SCF082_LOCUS51620, partial [Durusdinium trenchii]
TAAAARANATRSWEFCAAQGEVCSCEGRLRWGTRKQFRTFEPREDGTWPCNFETLGDPAPGDISKICECEVDQSRKSDRSNSNMEWIYCASQFMLCDCPGRIRWGNKNRWKIFPMQKKPLGCNTDLGDPAPGDAGKHCECELDPQSALYRKVNPSLRREVTAPVISCETFETSKRRTPWDREQWRAVEGLCAEPTSPPRGPEALTSRELRQMLAAWISEGFEANYQT